MSSLSSANMKIINTSRIFYFSLITTTFSIPDNIWDASFGKNRITIFFKNGKKTWKLRGISIWECMILIYPVCEVATKDQDIHHRHPLEWDDNAILLNFLLHWYSRFWLEKNYNEILKQLIIIEIILQKRNSCQNITVWVPNVCIMIVHFFLYRLYSGNYLAVFDPTLYDCISVHGWLL